MVHDYHEGLDGYSAGQLLHDGCGECEERSKEPWLAISHMDRGTFTRAVLRAIQYGRDGVPDMSVAEYAIVHTLWVTLVQFNDNRATVREALKTLQR